VGGDAPDPELAATAAVFVGVAVGFLIFNFPPAKIFMGDAGALLLGFALAGLAIRLPAAGDAPLKEFAVAACVLAIPLFDTALVWVTRRAARRPGSPRPCRESSRRSGPDPARRPRRAPRECRRSRANSSME
ncbi:MAG TPA: hypothetical protein EYQ27_16230, partial [Gemmatimonadetes bacterium]|nr:hypothetical protein [Gemmatimonadota bacterium]